MNFISMKKTSSEAIFSTHNLVTMAMFTALLCISAYLSITLPNGLHITFLNFMITLITLLFPASQAVCIIFIWLLMGFIGLPVFAGGCAGAGYLFGPYGGYNIAFFLTAIGIPFLCGKTYQRLRYLFAAIIAVIFVDLFGSLWIMFMLQISFPAALLTGFVPFIVLDFIKAVIAAQLVPTFRPLLDFGTVLK